MNPSYQEFKVIPYFFKHTILEAFPDGSVLEDLPHIPTALDFHDLVMS